MLIHLPKCALSITLMISLLAGCGGGNGDGGGTPPAMPAPDPGPQVGIDIPARVITIPSTGSIPVSADIRMGQGTIGIGPAFNHERPNINDLPPGTVDGLLQVRSGHWRDSQGHDGSASAGEVAHFIQSMQRESGPLFIYSLPGGPDVLRISSAARPDEREAVLAALRNINTARPWETRMRLGPELPPGIAGGEAVPANEIHVHFTDGKSAWPSGYMDHPPETLGIGGRQSVGGAPRGGFAYIDRTAIASDALLEFVITHEILHAAGFGGHVEEEEYPDSIMSPAVRPDIEGVPRLYLTIDGEADLVNLPDGPLPAVVTAGDLGVWETDAFHLLASMDVGGGADDGFLQFGAGFRNGLAKPWAHGAEPAMRLADNRALALTATWTGGLLGFSAAGRTVAGDAQIGIDLRDADGQADFTALESWNRGEHPGAPGSGHVWGDGDLRYRLELWEEGVRSGFDSTFDPGDDPGIVTGVFVGSAHEGAAGVLEHPDLSAGFGAVR